MRQLYLHAGLPRTGTSYLQQLFLRNRELLGRAGLGFGPYMDPRTGSHYPRFVAALETLGAEAVLAETEACPGERLLVSNEDLAYFLTERSPGGRTWAEAIRDAAAGRFAVILVVCVRRQDFLKESSFAQVVKQWYCGDIRGDHHYDYDLNGRLLALEAVFGREPVRPIVYDDLRRNDLVAPFLAALGLAVEPGELAPVAPQNVSMHRRKVLFLGAFPKPAAARELRPEARYPAEFVTRVLTGSTAVADDGGRFLLSPAERRALVAAHLAGNRALVERHGLAEAGSFLDLPDADEPWTPPAPITGREIAAVWREAIAACRAGRDPLRAAWLAARLSRPFAAMAARARRAPPPPARAAAPAG